MLSCLLITCWKRADLLVLLCVMFSCVFVTLLYGVQGQVWYFIVLISEFCLFLYFKHSFIREYRCHCVVFLCKNINPSLVLVQPRKTRPFITERLLMGCKESNQTNKNIDCRYISEVKKLKFLNNSTEAKIADPDQMQLSAQSHMFVCVDFSEHFLSHVQTFYWIEAVGILCLAQ